MMAWSAIGFRTAHMRCGFCWDRSPIRLDVEPTLIVLHVDRVLMDLGTPERLKETGLESSRIVPIFCERKRLTNDLGLLRFQDS